MLSWPIRHLQFKQEYAQGNWSPELEDKLWAYAQLHPTTANILLYIKVKHSISGFTVESLEALQLLADESGVTRSSALRARLLSLRLEISGHGSSNRLKHEISTLSINSIRPYPQLLQLADTGMCVSKTLAREQELAVSFCNRLQTTEQFFDQQPHIDTLAIVGNSNNETGRKSGLLIDSADIVIRFNNAVIDPTHCTDYGSKIDAWVLSPSHKIKRDALKASDIMISGNSPFHKPTRYWKQLAAIPSVCYYTFSTEAWYTLVQQLNAPPSAGLLCMTDLSMLALKESDIKVYGINRSSVIAETNHYGDRGKRSSRHNWTAEAMLMNELVRQFDSRS